MDNEKYINKVTLEFLLNPVLQEKLKKTSNNIDLSKDIKFYRKRICQITKDMSRGEFIDETLRPAFIGYATTLIYHFKQLDEKDIYQTEYDDLSDNTVITDINVDICSKNLDSLLLNTCTPTNNLDSFVKKINVVVPTKILPQRRIANTKDPSLKIKGVKKKNIS
jgi:hypothetical protein